MTRLRPLLILQMGRPPRDLRDTLSEQPDWFRAALADDEEEPWVVRPFAGDPLPAPGSFRAAIITGSWSMVTDKEDWSERTAGWIREVVAAGVPLLGVCYGHQLMAHALGGVVGYHPQGREVGIHAISVFPDGRNDPLLAGLPEEFPAHLTHEQTVLVAPPNALVLGRSAHDRHQILRYGPNAASVQFHPEFTPAVMTACIARRRSQLAGEGRDVATLLSNLPPTPHARTILQRFVLGATRRTPGAS